MNRTILFRLSLAALALTGAAQMPIFKRYWLASLPGLGWLGDYYLTHTLHYLAAVVFLFLLAEELVRSRLTRPAPVLAVLYLGVAATGLARVLKNLPEWFFSPGTAMAMDISHLVLGMLLGFAALIPRLRRGRS